MQNAVCAMCTSIYAHSYWHIFHTRKREYACMSYEYTRMNSVLLRRTLSLNKLKGQYSDSKSGCETSVGPSLNPLSLSLKHNSRDTVPLRLGERPTDSSCQIEIEILSDSRVCTPCLSCLCRNVQ